jgi:hypothetical protein
VDTVTGVKQLRLPVASFSWVRMLNQGGSGLGSIPLRSSGLSRAVLRAATTPVSRTLVIAWDDVPIYAGLVWQRKYHQATGVLTFRHGDIWSLFTDRLAIDFTAPNMEVTKQVYSGLSLATIAKRRVQLATTAAAFRNRSLPITLPADVSGSESRTYFGYHVPILANDLDDLTSAPGGMSIDLSPRWVDNKLDIQMRAGVLNSGVYEWNLAAEKSGVIGLTLEDDGAKLATNSVAIGEGSGADMLIRTHPETDVLYPAMDHVASYKQESSEAVLFSRAVANLETFGSPTEQWGFGVLASGSPAVTDLMLGGTTKVFTADDPWIEDGGHTNRLIGFSGDLSDVVQLQLQPGGA